MECDRAEVGSEKNCASCHGDGGKGDGAPVSSFIELGGRRVAALLSAPGEMRVLLGSRHGYGFICPLKDMVSRQKAGKAFVNLDGAELLPPVVLHPDDREIAVQANDGRLLVMPLEEIKTMSGGKGVQIMALEGRESLVLLSPVRETLLVTALNARNQRRQAAFTRADLEPYRGKRARRGKPARR